jgi:hypothetical protein
LGSIEGFASISIRHCLESLQRIIKKMMHSFQMKEYEELLRQLEAAQRNMFDYQAEVEEYHDELANAHA